MHTGERVTFAFAQQAGIRGERNCRPLEPIIDFLGATKMSIERVRQTTLEAMSRWSAVANIAFVETDGDHANIVIGAAPNGDGIAFTDVSYKPAAENTRFAQLTRALICLDPTEEWTIASDRDPLTRNLLYVMTHELGHAIGIDHPGRRGALMAFAYEENSQALTASDVAAAVALYGPTTTTPLH